MRTRVFRGFLFFPLSFLLFSCATFSPVPSGKAPAASPGTVVPEWLPFAAGRTRGLFLCAGKILEPRLEFRALRVDLSSPELYILTSGGPGDSCAVSGEGGGSGNGGNARALPGVRVSRFAGRNGLLAAINATPFDTVTAREGVMLSPAGIVVSGGRLISAPNGRFDALVFCTGGGAAIVSQSGIAGPEGIENAAGGFHRILGNGELTGRALNSGSRHARSAAGLSDDARTLFLLVIDGRRPGSIGATEAETAVLLARLGAREGINLDGGGSSALALRFPDGKTRIANIPSHGGIPGRERAVAVCLGIGLRTEN
ncbi:MAG: phosphodiester glycosidase family protein [Treponema sp.]|nr:phosphodiester glycosidase family protein [Treponema sp.]